jgi:2-haloacid dehalogenase
VIAFDVNETLLDLSALDSLFERLFGSAALRAQWFAQMLQLSFVGGLTGRYVDFPSAQRAALTMLAETAGTQLDPEHGERIARQMRRLPPHPDAAPALDRLREAGLTLAALTNSPPDVAQDQLAHAELADRFDRILSADAVKALKPRSEPYRMVARTFEAEPRDVRLVVAHAWDVSGALAAGCSAAFVSGAERCSARSAIGPTSSAPICSRSPTASRPPTAVTPRCQPPARSAGTGADQ